MSLSPNAACLGRLLIATDGAIEAIVRAALELRGAEPEQLLLVLIGAEAAFPFKPRPSTILVPGMPDGVIACVPQLDEFGVASRLASTLGLPGCYDGPVLELAEAWLKSPGRGSPPAKIEILVSARERLGQDVEKLGRGLGLPVSVIPSLETSL